MRTKSADIISSAFQTAGCLQEAKICTVQIHRLCRQDALSGGSKLDTVSTVHLSFYQRL